ncbi:peptide deformylase [Candidatus Zinderia endosymbiont of Aphrophora alni]|uniref:peptide deformylase n=1 Tax=Candidatus Zinderia endosymbiont of Aphrophora alni TaxID=3077951 RepID=UPI0030CCCF5D
MTIKNILEYPNLGLRINAKPVKKFNNSIKKIIKDMKDTLYNSSGIGLAATQINIHKQIIIIDITNNKNNLLIFINPIIIKKSKKNKINKEGCLSIPKIYKNISRISKIKIQFQNIFGKIFIFKIKGILSFCIQHEIDHLNGKLIIDY